MCYCGACWLSPSLKMQDVRFYMAVVHVQRLRGDEYDFHSRRIAFAHGMILKRTLSFASNRQMRHSAGSVGVWQAWRNRKCGLTLTPGSRETRKEQTLLCTALGYLIIRRRVKPSPGACILMADGQGIPYRTAPYCTLLYASSD